MADARGQSVSVRIGARWRRQVESGATTTEWAASGRTITFPGYLRAYVEGSDDPDGRPRRPRAAAARPRPPATSCPTPPSRRGPHHQPAGPLHRGVAGQAARGARHRPAVHLRLDHADDPGPRLRLEEGHRAGPVVDGVRRRATCSSSTSATSSTTRFTARMEDDLDEIAAGSRGPRAVAAAGSGSAGATAGRPASNGRSVRRAGSTRSTPAADQHHPARRRRRRERDRGQARAVRALREAGRRHRARCPTDLAPDELTVDKALELLAAPKGDQRLGADPESGLTVFVKPGRFGPYVQLGEPDDAPEGRSRRWRRCSRRWTPDRSRWTTRCGCSACPGSVGTDPADRRGDHRPERPLRALPQEGQRTAAASSTEERDLHGHRRRGAAHVRRAQAAGAGQRRPRRSGSWATTRCPASRWW